MPSLTAEDLPLLGQALRFCAACQGQDASLACAACQANLALVAGLKAALRRACPEETERFQISFPMRLVSTMNARESWRRKADRVEEEKKVATLHLWSRGGRSGARFLPCRVEMMRAYGKRSRPFDTDNAEAAFKGLRDAASAWLGVDDREGSGVTWTVRQEPAERDLVRLAFWGSGL